MNQISIDATVGGRTKAKKIVVRKPGAVRLTAMCSQYGYNNCCCLEVPGIETM